MKQRSTTPVSNTSFAVKASLVAIAILMAVATPIQIGRVVKADEFDERIKTIQNEIDQYQARAGELKDKADTFQKEVDALTNQKNVIQSEVNLKQAEFDKLTADIAANEKSIATNQDVLGDTIANLYVDGKISTLEMLASSKNIGEYVDKQEYQSSVRETLTKTISDIKQTKKKLEQQKKDVERNLIDQRLARDELARKEAEQATLVAQTRGEEAAYQQLSGDREQQKLKVQQQQQQAIEAAMRRGGNAGSISGGGSLGSYASWAGNCYVDSNAWSHGGAGGNGQDPWGYGCNQCVSYAAWIMYQKTGYAAKYWGNANMWPASASGKFPVSSVPRGNALGVISAGQYGHIVYVERVYTNARGERVVDISQYNEWLPSGGWGQYSTRTGVSASTYDTYIYL